MKKNRLKTACMVFIADPTVNGATANTGDWTSFSLLATASMVVGRGHSAYRNALESRGVTRGRACTVDSSGSNELFTSNGHGFVNGNQVRVYTSSTSIPAGLSGGTNYFVISATTNTFQLSATVGGAAVAITTNGAGVVVAPGTVGCYVETAGSAGAYPTFQVLGNDAVAHFLSLFDRAYIGHAPSKEFCAKVKRFSRIKTEVYLYFFQFDAVQQAGQYNEWFDAIDALLVPTNRLTGTGVPTGPPTGWPAGCTGVDSAEIGGGTSNFASTCGGQDAPSGSTHNWLINVGGSTLLNANNADTGWAALVGFALNVRYPNHEVDGIMIDNQNLLRNGSDDLTGLSTNYAAEGANFPTGCRAMLNSAQRTIGRTYGFKVTTNGSGWDGKTDVNPDTAAHAIVTATYTTDTNPQRFSEFFFTLGGANSNSAEPLSAIRSNLRKVKSHGLTTALLGQRIKSSTGNMNSGSRVDHERWFSNSATPLLSATGVSLTPAATTAGGTSGMQPGLRGPGQPGATDFGTWDSFRNLVVDELGIQDKVYVVTARDGSSFIFYDEESMGAIK